MSQGTEAVEAEIESYWAKGTDALFQRIDDALARAQVPEADRPTVVKLALGTLIMEQYEEWALP